MASHKISEEFESEIPNYYDLGYKFIVSVRKNPSATNDKQFQYKINKGSKITYNYGASTFTNFQPKGADQWIDFTFGTKDLYLYLDSQFGVKKDIYGDVNGYTIASATFKVAETLPDNFLAKRTSEVYKNPVNIGKYYITQSSRCLIAILPYLNKNPVIQIYLYNSLSIINAKLGFFNCSILGAAL